MIKTETTFRHIKTEGLEDKASAGYVMIVRFMDSSSFDFFEQSSNHNKLCDRHNGAPRERMTIPVENASRK